MKKIWTSLFNNKYLNIFIISLYIIGLIFGIIIFLKQNTNVKDILLEEIVPLKNLDFSFKSNLISSSIILFLIFILGFSIIGIFLSYFYLFYEGVSIGFLGTILVSKYGFKGILFLLIYCLIIKVIFFSILALLLKYSSEFSKKMFNAFIKKEEHNLNYIFKRYLLKFVIVIVLNLLNSVLIYFIGLKLLKIFIFLL